MKQNKKLSIAIIACLHGDEIAGKYVIDKLKKDKSIRDNVGLFIAHPQAVAKKKRFLIQDLNRSFPGKIDGNIEEQIAYSLYKKLQSFDFILDIHTTNSKIDKLAITTSLSPMVRSLLRATPIKKVALAPSKILGGGQLVRYHRAGASLEYGPDKSGENYEVILKDVLTILRNLDIISGEKKYFLKKELYQIFGTYKVDDDIVFTRTLCDFKFIKKGEIIGKNKKGEDVVSKESFYPIFLGNGRYPNTLSLMSSKSILKL